MGTAQLYQNSDHKVKLLLRSRCIPWLLVLLHLFAVCMLIIYQPRHMTLNGPESALITKLLPNWKVGIRTRKRIANGRFSVVLPSTIWRMQLRHGHQIMLITGMVSLIILVELTKL